MTTAYFSRLPSLHVHQFYVSIVLLPLISSVLSWQQWAAWLSVPSYCTCADPLQTCAASEKNDTSNYGVVLPT